MANITNVINVQLLEAGTLAQRDNLNVVSVITSETGFLSTAKRTQIYSDIASVAADFGTESAMYSHASTFFATSPNPVNAGGYLIAGFWRAAEETVAATAATLTSAELVEATAISDLQSISDGSFDITVDGSDVSVTGIDTRVVTTLDEVAALLSTAITGATVAMDDDGLTMTVTSSTTGASSALTYVTAGSAGTFIGTILGLATGTGALLVQGVAAGTLDAETKVAAVTAIKAEVDIYGAVFIDQPTSVEAKSLATWAQANSVIVYDVFSSADNLLISTSNVVWDIKLSSLSNYRCLYSAAGNRNMATSYMARAHVVNFSAENSALTMHMKELSVAAETYTQTQITNAKLVGLDIYTTIKNTPVVLTSGANDFVDNVYNLLGYIDAMQTDMFNLLKATSTKIPQTARGVRQLEDQAEKTTKGFVKAGVFAAGTWSSPDSFGDIDVFERSIEKNGYYILAGSLADQSQAEREARESPVLQVAVKNAGAIHSVDMIINFNK